MDWTRGRTIGRGASATVSVAMAHQSSELFAVKSVELSQSEFLQREQSMLSLLKSPQIVQYMGCDVTTENGKVMYNLFMEYISGGTLTDAIQKQGGRLKESTIRSHTRAILQGLEYLHSNRLVHCDIKGRNVLVGNDGAKIADLGCARWIDKEEASRRPIAGTPVFMAPEVARGEEQGFPSDVWALGCTVIEMATGRPPWSDADTISVLYRIAFSGDVPEFPSFLSEEAKDFLSKCLRRDPNERWTVNQLLKHPFVDEPNSQLKQIQESTSNSPTCVLDQDFWNSFEELETRTNTCSSNSPAERLRQLSNGISSSSPRLPNWTWEENWVTIRCNNNNDDDDNDREGEGENFSSQNHNMIAADEPMTTTSTSGSLAFWISSVVDKDLLNYSVNDVSSSRSRSKFCSGGDFVKFCKCISSNFNFKTHRISVFCNSNSLKALYPT